MSQTGAATRFVTSVLLLVAIVDVMLVAGAPVDGISQEPASDSETPVGDDESIDRSLTQVPPVEGFDDVQIHIRVNPDRSATWSVKYRYRLANDSTEEAFQRTRRNLTNPPGVFIERMQNASRRAEQRTGREMRVLNGTVSAYHSVPHGRFGIVEFRCTWAGFAAAGEGDRLVVGDTLSGYPLPENESLVFSWADRFQPAAVSPAPNASGDTVVRWDGPHDFAVENPTLVLTRGEQSSTPSSQSATVPFTMVAAAFIVVAALVALGYGLVTGGVVAALGSVLGDSDEDEQVPPELLSDEERVLQLVEDNGGRMKQQEVKEALDWSRTKTSNVVTDLQEAGKLEVYRLGRENTLALPEEMDL